MAFACWWRTSRFFTSDDVLDDTKDHESSEQILNNGHAHTRIILGFCVDSHHILGQLAKVILSKHVDVLLQHCNSSFKLLGSFGLPELFLFSFFLLSNNIFQLLLHVLSLFQKLLLLLLDRSQDFERVIRVFRKFIEGEVKDSHQ